MRDEKAGYGQLRTEDKIQGIQLRRHTSKPDLTTYISRVDDYCPTTELSEIENEESENFRCLFFSEHWDLVDVDMDELKMLLNDEITQASDDQPRPDLMSSALSSTIPQFGTGCAMDPQLQTLVQQYLFNDCPMAPAGTLETTHGHKSLSSDPANLVLQTADEVNIQAVTINSQGQRSSTSSEYGNVNAIPVRKFTILPPVSMPTEPHMVSWCGNNVDHMKTKPTCDNSRNSNTLHQVSDLPVKSPVRSLSVSTRKRLASGMTSDSDSDDNNNEDEDGSSSSDSEGDFESVDGKQQYAKEFLANGCKLRPYFWQYNAQNRGPKGKRLYSAIELKDPHKLNDFVDPIDNNDQTKNKDKHFEDPRPSPEKLLDIGRRIGHLEEEFRSVSLTNNGGRAKNKRDINKLKNKLSSRICRLKRKAQHEANKIKLNGLGEEHSHLMSVIAEMVPPLSAQVKIRTEKPASLQGTATSVNEAAGVLMLADNSCSATKIDGCSEEDLTTSRASTPSSALTELKRARLRFTPQTIIAAFGSLADYMQSVIENSLKFLIAEHTTEYVNSELKNFASRILADQCV